ncbi:MULTISPECIES: STAS domain-containing protein [Nocardioides]|uniref:STAS domain-containing protein n=1 Tax=Nocardioides kribbensis TaxID=305517 RepID=A0ABV1NWN8_9ACTN|nr:MULTISPECIES: STAS domain-containing protein [Nocardioides]KQP64592.1 anti-anti-sigma factor [Nocardioides sp. Leaf285]KQQ43600.1 anti-anti-sigma factor [Nocardioides sp. Leaf307]MBJ7530707.1 STAS domain-containing protein [Nocardioides sp.]MCM3515653.1 STAS domain-containing protein [Nocardioides sp. P86]
MDITTDGPTLALHGDFDVRSTFRVRTALYDHLDAHGQVVVDLTDVDTVDVTALKVLAFATRQASIEGHHLVLRGAGPAVRRLLHLSHLIRVVDLDRVTA